MKDFAQNDVLKQIINKQYITLINRVIVTTISNYAFDEIQYNNKFLYLNEDIKSNNIDSVSSFLFDNDLTQLFQDKVLVEVIKTLKENEKQLLIDFYIKDYSLEELAKKNNSTIKAISNKKNRLLKKIKELYIKLKGGN